MSQYQYLAKLLDIPEKELRQLSPEEIHSIIESKKKFKLKFKSLFAKIIPRGNPLITTERFIDHDKFLYDFEKRFK